MVAHAALAFVFSLVVLAGVDIALLNLHSGHYAVDIGDFRDKAFLFNAHRQEVADGVTYRWTTEESNLWLSQIDVGPHTALTLMLGGRPQPGAMRLSLNETPWTTLTAATEPRRYRLLLPHRADHAWLDIGIASDTFNAAGDNRRLGVKLDGFKLQTLADGPRLPAIAHLQPQILALLFVHLTALRLRWRRAAQTALGAAAALALAFILSFDLLLAHSYLPRLAVAAAALALVSWIALPWLEQIAAPMTPRTLHTLWALALAACAIRLAGVLYPTFSGQDMGFHTAHMTEVATGRLFLITGSTEFGGRAVYPPGVYLSVIPGILVTDDLRALLQIVLAILDGLTALMVGFLALRLGGNLHAARIAIVLYAGSIAALGALNFGFAAQIFGQWFVAPLGLLLLREEWPPSTRTWALVALVTVLAIFSHAGGGALVAGWLGLLLAALLLTSGRRILGALAPLALAALIGFALLYVSAAALMLGNAARQVQGAAGGAVGMFPGFSPLLVSGARLAYSEVGIMLLPLGIACATMARHPRRMIVVGAWLATAAIFLMINILTTMQVRYFYFALPAILALIALPLGQIATRGPGGRRTAWTLALALALPGILLWFQTTMSDGRISMTPLTH